MTIPAQLTNGTAVRIVHPGLAVRRPSSFFLMKPSKSIDLKSRAAAKAASRKEDRRRLENGESPEAIQRENSIFPPGYFQRRRIINFASAIGK